MQSKIQCIQSQLGKSLLQLNSFRRYRKEKIHKDADYYWRCTDKLCKGGLNIKYEEIIKGNSGTLSGIFLLRNMITLLI